MVILLPFFIRLLETDSSQGPLYYLANTCCYYIANYTL